MELGVDREINVVVEKLSRLRELRAVVSTNNTSCLRAWGLCEHSRTSRRMPTPFLSIGVWNFSFFFSSRRRRALRQERAVKSSANNASNCQSINCFVFLFSFFFPPLFFFLPRVVDVNASWKKLKKRKEKKRKKGDQDSRETGGRMV